MAADIISPVPEKSAIVGKEGGAPKMDWLRWFNSVREYALRLLNYYDSSKAGEVTLVAGIVVVANTQVTVTSKIRLSVQTAGGTRGHLSIVLNAGVGFTINSSSASDTSTIFYEIVEAF